jgi:hypothetical protein
MRGARLVPKRRSRARVMAPVHGLQVSTAHVGVDLGRRHRAVPEQVLDGPQVGAVLQHVSGVGVAEHVGRRREARGGGVLGHDTAHVGGVQGASAPARPARSPGSVRGPRRLRRRAARGGTCRPCRARGALPWLRGRRRSSDRRAPGCGARSRREARRRAGRAGPARRSRPRHRRWHRPRPAARRAAGGGGGAGRAGAAPDRSAARPARSESGTASARSRACEPGWREHSRAGPARRRRRAPRRGRARRGRSLVARTIRRAGPGRRHTSAAWPLTRPGLRGCAGTGRRGRPHRCLMVRRACSGRLSLGRWLTGEARLRSGSALALSAAKFAAPGAASCRSPSCSSAGRPAPVATRVVAPARSHLEQPVDLERGERGRHRRRREA